MWIQFQCLENTCGNPSDYLWEKQLLIDIQAKQLVVVEQIKEQLLCNIAVWLRALSLLACHFKHCRRKWKAICKRRRKASVKLPVDFIAVADNQQSLMLSIPPQKEEPQQ